jgi:hypothetical protein
MSSMLNNQRGTKWIETADRLEMKLYPHGPCRHINTRMVAGKRRINDSW